MNIITEIAVAIIVGVFILYLIPLFRLKAFSTKLCNETDPTSIDKNNKLLHEINHDYDSTKTILSHGEPKTLHEAEEFYNPSEFARCKKINLKHINSAPGILSGLGVLGTFVGLTISVTHFDSTDSTAIMSSIKNLLGGMGTAFITSLVGMALSSIYIWLQKSIYNRYENNIAVFNRRLDLKYRIPADQVLLEENEKSKQEILSKLLMLDKLNEIQDSLYIMDDEGSSVSAGNMLLNLYEEAEKQSQALESFTTDLSNELNASLGKTMNTSIVPLIQNLERCHDTMNTKIENLSNNIQSPATDFVTTAISELQNSMRSMTNEFKDTISGQTINQMENLADNLAKAGDMLNIIPQTMKLMSDNISASFSQVHDIVGRLQTSVAEQQERMIATSRSANDQLVEDFKQKFNDMTAFQQSALSSMSEHLDATIQSLTSQLEKAAGSLNEQQNNLSDSHERSTREIERLLQSFAQSISNMHNVNNESAETIVSIQKASENLNGSTDKLKTLAEGLGSTTMNVIEQQKESVAKYEDIQQQNLNVIEQIATALEDARKLVDGYVEDFDTIKGGLKEIFKGINEGLKDYSTTLRESTGEALADYSEAITKSTNGLRNIAEALEESAEELTDGIEKIKRMR